MSEYLSKLHKVQIELLDEIDKICKQNNLQYYLVGGTLLGAVRHKGFIPWDDDIDVGMPRKDLEKFISIVNNMKDSKFFINDRNNSPDYFLVFPKICLKNTVYEEKKLKVYKGNKCMWIDLFVLDDISDVEKALKKEKLLKIIKNALYLKNTYTTKTCDKINKKIRHIILLIIPNKLLHFFADKIMISNKEEGFYANFGSQYGALKQVHSKEKYIPAKELEFEGKLYKVPNDYNYILRKIYGNNYMELPPIEKRITHNPIKIKFEDGEEIVFNEEV